MRRKITLLMLIACMSIMLSSCAWNGFYIFTGDDNPFDVSEPSRYTSEKSEETAKNLGSAGEEVELRGKVRYTPYSEKGSLLEVYDIDDESFYLLYSNDTKIFNDVRNDDFFYVKGTVMENSITQSIGGHDLELQCVEVGDVEFGDYIDIMEPTITTIDVNETQTDSGIAVTLRKIEISNGETRAYVAIENNSKEWLYCNDAHDSTIIQNDMEYDPARSDYLYKYQWDSSLDPDEKSSGIMFVSTPLDPNRKMTVRIGLSGDAFEEYTHYFRFSVPAQGNVSSEESADSSNRDEA